MFPRYAASACFVLLAAWFVASLPASRPAQGAARTAEGKFSQEAEAAADARKAQIEQEIRALKAHPWAGSYYFGDGLGVNVYLALAPKSGFVFTWYGCLGLYDRNYGDLVEENGHIRLVLTFPNKREGFEGIAPELIPVLWGERHYLIPSDGVVEFANAINAGFEPRNRGSSSFLLKDGDEERPVRGQPSIPAQYSAYLLRKPIAAHIVSVKESRKEGSCRITIVLLDVGADQGVLQDMEFYVRKPSSVFDCFEITSVEASRSEAKIVQYLQDKSLPPGIGWKLSTRVMGD